MQLIKTFQLFATERFKAVTLDVNRVTWKPVNF